MKQKSKQKKWRNDSLHIIHIDSFLFFIRTKFPVFHSFFYFSSVFFRISVFGWWFVSFLCSKNDFLQSNDTHITHNSSFRRQDIARAIHNMLDMRADQVFINEKTYYSPFLKNGTPSSSSSCIVALLHIAYPNFQMLHQRLPWCSKKSRFWISSILYVQKNACNSTGINTSIFDHLDVGIKILTIYYFSMIFKMMKHENRTVDQIRILTFFVKKNKIKNSFWPRPISAFSSNLQFVRM